METLTLKPFSVVPSGARSRCSSWTSKSARVVACSGALKPNSISMERASVVVRAEHGGAVMEAAGSVILAASPNGKSEAEIGVKSLVPYGGLVDMHEDGGIGIVKFLRGKVFFITGATGFLAKGTLFFLIIILEYILKCSNTLVSYSLKSLSYLHGY